MQQTAILKTERGFVTAFLLCIVLPIVRAVQAGWLVYAASARDARTFVPNPMLYAPNAYRVAMPALQHFLIHLLHTANWPAVCAAIDGIFLFPALYLGYLLAVEGLQIASLKRFTVIALYLAFLQFPAAWIVPWQRSETTPTTFYVLFVLIAFPRAAARKYWAGIVLAATFAESFVRSDVPIIMGFSLILVSAFYRDSSRLQRLSMLVQGVGVLITGAAVQAYLQYVRFPRLSYPPGTSMIQLAVNLRASVLSGMAITLLPFLGLAIYLLFRQPRFNPGECVALVGAALYLPLLAFVASLREVRLFVPFMVAMSFVAARTFAADRAFASLLDGEPRVADNA